MEKLLFRKLITDISLRALIITFTLLTSCISKKYINGNLPDADTLSILKVGKDDKNTPPGVSKYYYDLLEKKKLQVKLHIIDGGHGLRSMPTIGSVIKEYLK